MTRVSARMRFILVAGLLCLGVGTLGCGAILSATQLASSPPRFTCPTPTPLPTIRVADGSTTHIVDGTPVSETTYRNTQPYEIEYGLPPVAPTTYAREWGSFPLGTIVNLGSGVDAMLTVAPQAITRAQGDGTERLSRIRVEWNNPGPPLAFDPYRQLVITQIREASGRLRGGTWRWSPDVVPVSDLPHPTAILETSTEIATGRSVMEVDVFAPDGTVAVAELRLDAAMSAGTGGARNDMRVQFVDGPADPNCDTNGLFAPAPDPARPAAQPIAVPAGTNAAVAAALTQLGRPYCWGGKGYTPCDGCGGGTCYAPCESYPCFDCSGLTSYAWAQAGVSIGSGSANQSARLPTVPRGDPLLPGDVLFFTANPGGGGINHVTLNAGDVNGNGTPDMVEAAWYGTPLRIVDNWSANSYYASRFAFAGRPNTAP